MNTKGERREYWQPTEETLPIEKLEELQDLRLRNTVERVYENVPFYRKKLEELGITPSDITKRDDVETLPFTRKADLRNHFPFGLFAVPHEQVIRIHASSGTSGPPTVIGYTARDIASWANMMARCLTMEGINHADVFQNAVAMDYLLVVLVCITAQSLSEQR